MLICSSSIVWGLFEETEIVWTTSERTTFRIVFLTRQPNNHRMREKNPKAVASREYFCSGLRSLDHELEMQRYRKKVFGHL